MTKGPARWATRHRRVVLRGCAYLAGTVLVGIWLTKIALDAESRSPAPGPASMAMAELDGATLVATAGPDGTAHIYRGDTELGIVRGHSAAIERVAFAGNGSLLVTTDTLGNTQVTRVNSLAANGAFGLTPRIDSLRIRLWTDLGAPFAERWLSAVRFAAAYFPAQASPGLAFHRNTNAGKTIVIDPGHGGIDSGDQASTGLVEKNLVLDEARILAQVLRERGYRVVLTRDKDVFIPLRERADMAEKNKADLLISLHADSSPDASVRGLSVYTLSDAGLDKLSAQLAQRENQSDTLVRSDSTRVSARTGLSPRETLVNASQFADLLLDALSNVTELLPGQAHRSAAFVVLQSPDVPSVLVELGYVSNTRDADQMSTPAWRSRIASAIGNAVDRYFQPTEALRDN